MSEEILFEDKKSYEISFLLAEEAAKAEIDKALQSVNAEVGLRGACAEVKFAYPVKKHASGFFGYVHFKATSEQAAQLKAIVENNQKVLRTLLVTPPVIMQPREPRPERRAPGTTEERTVPQKAAEVRPVPQEAVMSNEALEKKLEEILN